MNKKGSGPPLTWILIGALIGLTVIALAFSSYTEFVSTNNLVIENNYSDYYNELEGYNDDLGEDANELSDKGLLDQIWSAVASGVVVFVTGLAAIAKLFEMLPVLKGVIQTASQAIPGFEPLFGLFTLVVTVYIAMAYVKGRRGTGSVA